MMCPRAVSRGTGCRDPYLTSTTLDRLDLSEWNESIHFSWPFVPFRASCFYLLGACWSDWTAWQFTLNPEQAEHEVAQLPTDVCGGTAPC